MGLGLIVDPMADTTIIHVVVALALDNHEANVASVREVGSKSSMIDGSPVVNELVERVVLRSDTNVESGWCSTHASMRRLVSDVG